MEPSPPSHTDLDAMARAQALIELSYEGFTIFDAQATIIFESESNGRITGYRPDECLGRSLFEFIHPEDTERLLPRFARLAELPGELDSDIVRWRHRDGHWIYLEGTVVNQLQDPHIRGMINTFHDVTARIELERELTKAKEIAEAQQLKQQRFLAMLSHELRTPLTLIKQPLEEIITAHSADSRWGIVGRGLRRLESLVEELVDFTVLDSGQTRLRVRELKASDLIKEVVCEMQPLAEARQMTLLFEETTPGIHLYLDQRMFTKALMNLIGNAIKFAPADTVVKVRAFASDDQTGESEYLEIEVEDAGTPIPEEEREQIFERYYQVGSGDDRGWEGMGLGLSLAEEVIALHGGEIGLRPAKPNGNCFWIRVPLGVDHISIDEIALEATETATPPFPLKVFQTSQPQKTGDQPPAFPDDGVPPARVLIVEDHPDLQRFLAQQLETIYTLSFAANGVEALPLILTNPPDLVLSDVMMPGMDGVTLCRKIREHHSPQKLPILLLSAKGRAEDRLQGLQAGANDYLSKPFSMDELRLRIHTHLSVRREPTKGPTSWPGRVREVLHNLMGQGPFGASELAAALGLSQRQFQRRCVEAFGQTPGQLIQEVRLQRARELLEGGEIGSVADAARAVGLSASYLSRRFRATFNQAPKDLLQGKA
jgi:PAS domain S-box-containing protein